MGTNKFISFLKTEIENIKNEGLYKEERYISSPQGSLIEVNGKKVLNFCANNYLGLSSHPEVLEEAKESISKYGYGMSSVRFICGTQDIHKELENKLSEFLGTEDTILYAAAFDANGGVFEPLLNEEDAIISDSLNHASIIDGVRLCKAKRFRYENNNMEDLENQLIAAKDCRFKLIVTDGVFSMDGYIAQLDKIYQLAKKYSALTMVDESHATGFVGKHGRGTIEHCDVIGKFDIITGTLGKALGGASGGFTSGKKEIIDILRQRSRPYLFSNTLMPTIVNTTLKVLEILTNSTTLRDKLEYNTTLFRSLMTEKGFDILKGTHPITPVMLYDAKLAQQFSKKLLEEGIYVIGFFYPVVPKDKARIRVQISAGHNEEDILKCVNAFEKVGKELGVI